MAKSSAVTVADYLNELPEDRRAIIAQIREVITANLPPGYVECMNWGMISYEIPLTEYPHTYNKQPLSYVALAAQKNYYAIYLNGIYQDPERNAWFHTAFQQAGQKLDMGKSCVRFKRISDIPLTVIGQAVASITVADFIAQHEKQRNQ